MRVLPYRFYNICPFCAIEQRVKQEAKAALGKLMKVQLNESRIPLFCEYFWQDLTDRPMIFPFSVTVDCLDIYNTVDVVA